MMSPADTFRIMVVGSKHVGKSALVVKYLTGRFIGEYQSDTEVKYKTNVLLEGESVSVEISDSTELEETIVSWADGFMIVFDVTKETSFESIAQIKEDLEYKKSAKNISYVVVGNKADLEHSREVSPERARKLCLTIPAAYFECCACAANDNGKTESLREAFAELCREIKRRKSVSGNNKPERRLSLFRRLVPSSNPKKQTLSPPNQGLGMPYRRGGGSTLRRRKSVAGLIGMQDRSERSRSPIPPICLEEPDDQRTQTFGRPLRRYGVDGLYVKP